MLVYKMNQLLLLGGLVLALYVMNEKKMFAGLSKTLSSGKNNTMLVLVFCGVILFMCMQKGNNVEGMVDASRLSAGCESLGLISHKVAVLDQNNQPTNPVDICVTSCEEKLLTKKDLTDSPSDVADESSPESAPEQQNQQPDKDSAVDRKPGEDSSV
jgi:hypothetical protein